MIVYLICRRLYGLAWNVVYMRDLLQSYQIRCGRIVAGFPQVAVPVLASAIYLTVRTYLHLLSFAVAGILFSLDGLSVQSLE